MVWRRCGGPDWLGAPILYPRAPSVKFGQLRVGLAKIAIRPGTEPISYRFVTEPDLTRSGSGFKVAPVDWRATGKMGSLQQP